MDSYCQMVAIYCGFRLVGKPLSCELGGRVILSYASKKELTLIWSLVQALSAACRSMTEFG